jgi:hypothetical protein
MGDVAMSFFFPDDKPSQEPIPGTITVSEAKPTLRLSSAEIVGHLAQMPVLHQFENGSRWYELNGLADAVVATRLSGTAIAPFYEQEAVIEGGHPRRWFGLLEDNMVMPVVLCVTPPGVEVKQKIVEDCHITGRYNSNPYPDYADEIASLSEVIGVDLPPNYMGRPIEEMSGPKF